MDPVGTILFCGSVCCLLLVLTLGGSSSYPWNSARCIGLFVGAGVLGLCFCFWLQKRGEVALIPLRVLQKRSICMGALILFGLGMASQTVRTGFHSCFSAQSDTDHPFLVRLLFANILSSCSGSIDDTKRGSIYRIGHSNDFCDWGCRSHRVEMGPLREDAALSSVEQSCN